ncbi:SusC/RagA family TonB-linked outer membrane protein [Mucilaginibacter limnophilus]|uniref:SusC/RagA family TonB-linked outer membrane protein n=1 Tax=Mucilaginibacter limnophilus TaxID=1932778 RepID=A0A3S2UP58_9SPHI|nr:SusC/RagA family TonB-linked outer membrane protein [Mucilaginibacter limnophilus]RVU00964.1 SusC/RagA family TonB-linked outer membrane protein [Mucilaginibacter limnophilus]
MKKKLLLILFLPGITCGAYAGSRTLNIPRKSIVSITSNMQAPIKGVVRDNAGQPLPGVSITVKGTTKGAQSDINGQFTVDAEIGDILIISYVGYVTQEIKVSSTAQITINISEDSKQLSEVVVTALGIKKERRAIGYSVTEVKGEDLTKTREVSFMNALVGKVAGVNINSLSGGPGASTNVQIRGVANLSGYSQPLYVINGIPVESNPGGHGGTLTGGAGQTSNNSGSQWDNSADNGDAISNLNPDDIETITVLKGAAASALYGYRAKAGVILITTKSAKNNSVEFNSNYVAETIIDPTDWQYQYGQGANNVKPADQASAFQAGQSSYGGLLDGSQVVQFDGVSRPYVAQRSNLSKFYRTGGGLTNTIAFNKLFDGGSVRFSASDLHYNAVVPNSGLNRQTFDLNTNYNISKHFVVTARANYILEQGNNRPFVGDGAGNPNFNAWFLPSSVDINTLKPGSKADGSELGYSSNTFATNPWFATENYINNTRRTRLLTNATLRYNFDDGTFLQGRIGRDAYNDRNTNVVPSGTAYRPLGSISEESVTYSDIESDVLAGRPVKINDDLTITPTAGASYRRQKVESIVNSGDTFAVPFIYNLGNATKNKAVTVYPGDMEIHSVYGALEINYKSYLYLNGTGRSDWFSTLATPGKDNRLSIFYPSLSGSFVFSELWKPTWLYNGKLRAGYAKVGSATTPYQTALSYGLNSAYLNGLPLGSILNSNIPNDELKPSYATEIEIGAELSFFNNRLSFDLAWYNKKSYDEILPAQASGTSGYTGAVLNIGKLQNKGFEALINGSPIKGNDFNWNVSLNGSINNSKVLALANGTDNYLLATSRSGVGFTQDVVGLPIAQVMAYDYAYDANGNISLDPNTGLPLRGKLTPYGSAYAKWIGGITNTFNYKQFSLSFLIDGKFGGKIYSTSNYYGYIFGLHKATLENRTGNFGTDAKPINAATYYSTLANNVSKLFVQDASFIKFRSINFSYNLPDNLFNGAVKTATISLVGRNLFYIMKKTDNIDPESSYSAYAQGIESGGLPTTRTYGLNLSVKF